MRPGVSIECIDMGGMDTRGRYHVHWGAPETYGERREESALRRSGRTVPDPATRQFEGRGCPGRCRRILERLRPRIPAHLLAILEAARPTRLRYLPVFGALGRDQPDRRAWYAMIYGTSFYGHLRFEPPTATEQGAAVDAHRPSETILPARSRVSLAGGPVGRAGPQGAPN